MPIPTSEPILYNMEIPTYSADIVKSSCSITFQNTLYLFGGAGSLQKQVTKLSGFRLVSVGTLNFSLIRGACANVDNKFLYLCFHFGDDNDKKLCRYSTKATGSFSSIEKSFYRHAGISIAAAEG